MTQIITANELKIRGIAAIDEATSDGDEAFISVRGKNRFVIIPIEKYNHLRECELESALRDSKEDLKKGKYFQESVENHIKRITRA